MRVYVVAALILTSASFGALLLPTASNAQLVRQQLEINDVAWSTKIRAWLGDHHAQIQLGLAYATGMGIERNMITAREWWEKTAKADEPDAQYALGLLSSSSGFDGGQQDFKQAAAWFARAAKHKLAWAQFSLGYLYAAGKIGEPDLKWAREWYQKSADGGNEYAQLNLGLLLQQEIDAPPSCIAPPRNRAIMLPHIYWVLCWNVALA
jgi:TPR repeat protein